MSKGAPEDLGTGSGHCLDFVECVQTCESEGCVNACGATVTAQALQLAMDFFGCLDQSGCYSAQTQEQFDNCLVGYCAGPAEACVDDSPGGDSGTAPGDDSPATPPAADPPADPPPADPPGADPPADPPAADPPGEDPPAADPPADDSPTGEPAHVPGDAEPTDPAGTPGAGDPEADNTGEPSAPSGDTTVTPVPGAVSGTEFEPAGEVSDPTDLAPAGDKPADGCGVSPHRGSGLPASLLFIVLALGTLLGRRRRSPQS